MARTRRSPTTTTRQVIALNKQAQKETDDTKRADLYSQLQKQASADSPFAYLYYAPYVFAMKDSVKGFYVDAARQLPPRGRLQDEVTSPGGGAARRGGATSRPSSADPYERGGGEVLDRFRFVPGRLLQAIPVLFGITLIVFFMVHLLPGNPAVAILGQTATPERVAALSKQLGLDEPLWDQYLLFLGNLFHGNLGTSITYQRPVSELVLQDFPVTLQLLAVRAGALAGDQRPAGGAGRHRARPRPRPRRPGLHADRPGHAAVLGRHHADPAARGEGRRCSRSAATARPGPSTGTTCSCPR